MALTLNLWAEPAGHLLHSSGRLATSSESWATLSLDFPNRERVFGGSSRLKSVVEAVK